MDLITNFNVQNLHRKQTNPSYKLYCIVYGLLSFQSWKTEARTASQQFILHH